MKMGNRAGWKQTKDTAFLYPFDRFAKRLHIMPRGVLAPKGIYIYAKITCLWDRAQNEIRHKLDVRSYVRKRAKQSGGFDPAERMIRNDYEWTGLWNSADRFVADMNTNTEMTVNTCEEIDAVLAGKSVSGHKPIAFP